MLRILRLHRVRKERLAAEGLQMNIAAVRGPMTVVPAAGGYHAAEDGWCAETGNGVGNS
jgi:hypothetical protein